MQAGYVFEHEGKKFDPNGQVAVKDTTDHNAALERSDLDAWARKPDHFAAYLTDKGCVTWLGTSLGTIVSRSRYRNNLGANIECVTVRGTNGATYHGRYGCDWSQLIWLRKAR